MNASFRPALFGAAILLLAACTTEHAPEAARGASACETLQERCARGGCATYDAVAARARKPQTEGSFFRYRIGTCGAYRFVSVQEGMGMGTDYFAADGTLVASTTVADAPVCEGSYGGTVGKVPACTETTTESHDWSVPAAAN